MKYGLKNSFWQGLNEIFKSYSQISKAKLFGSRAKGNYRDNSDVDIVLYGNTLDLSLLNRLELATEALFIPQKIDLIISHQIDNKELIDHIDRVGITIYGEYQETSFASDFKY